MTRQKTARAPVPSARPSARRAEHLDDLPIDFDLALYAALNDDLNALTPEKLIHHYTAYGSAEGRVCCRIDNRAAFLALIPDAARVLEIGPLCTPSFPPERGRIEYMDIMPTAELRKLAASYEWGDPEKVPEITYVWRGEPYASLVRHKPDIVFSSHNIEHQPCLLTQLRNVASILQPGGRMFLVVPDRRYCFDHYMPDSTIADVIEAWRERRTQPGALVRLRYRLLHTHNETAAHWTGDHGIDPRWVNPDPARAALIRELAEAPRISDGYDDVHCWFFTPMSFRLLIEQLSAAGLSSMRVERVYPTVRGLNEFFAVLRRG
jgi:SAM-dependent methyltransferase